MKQQAAFFLAAKSYAVAGASNNRDKYGYLIFNALRSSNRSTIPIHPTVTSIDNIPAFPSIKDCPIQIDALSIVTPPAATQQIINDAIEAGVKHIWIQPGAEHAEASTKARNAGINVIDDGSCILVALSYERR